MNLPLVRKTRIMSLVLREVLVPNSARGRATPANRNKSSKRAQLGPLDRIRRQASHRRVEIQWQPVRQMVVRLWAVYPCRLTAQLMRVVKLRARSLKVKRQVQQSFVRFASATP